jgi:hypothetical protein
MKAMMIMAIAILGVVAPLHGQASAPEVLSAASLAGRWRSAPFELSLTSDLHVSVYGSGARSVRSVSMTVEPSGHGVFRVTSSVRDRRGRLVSGTQEIQEVTFVLGDLVQDPGRQPHYATRVVKAERRFADDPASAFPREGVQLGIYARDTRGTIEVRFDTPEGTGSFWETLRRTGTQARQSSRS